MSAPDPEGMSLLAKVLAAGVAIVAPIWGVRTWLERRLEKKADKAETERCLKHIEKLYENAEADRKLTRDLHDEAMSGINEGQRQIIEILNRR